VELVVVIPCHRRWDLLPDAIAAVGGLPVVVVNDAPPGLAVDEPDGVTLVRTAGSQGFARAVNAGLAAACDLGATHALLLNDDARLLPGCIAALVASWNDRSGAVGPVLLDHDGAVESAGISVASWGRVKVAQRAPEGITGVDALSGACLMIRAGERLDEGFAHGFEDIELCSRLRRQGKTVRIVPAARCQHLGGATLSRRSPTAQRHAVSGHLRLLGRRRLVPVVVGLAVAQVIREGGPPGRLSGIAAGVGDWLRAAPSPAQSPPQAPAQAG
jgi:GT2 family glycosyltransferase